MDGSARQAASPETAPPALRRGDVPPETASSVHATVRSLQRSAGNRATAALLRRAAEAGPVRVQRQSHGRQAAGPGQAVTVNFTITPQPYQIHPHHLMQAAVRMGMPSGEAGRVTPNARYDAVPDARGRVGSVTVQVPLTLVLPEWPESSRLPPAARAEWERFLRALTAHEQGHIDIARRFFGPAVGHSLLHREDADAQATWDANVAAWRTENDAYDARTQHGITQGTTIDDNVDGATFDVTAAARQATTR